MHVEKRNIARSLRANGESVKRIAKSLEVAASTVSLWVRDVSLTHEQKIKLHGNLSRNWTFPASVAKERREAQKLCGASSINLSDPLHLAGCMLYWGEGGKTQCLDFTNSDPLMAKVFVTFLRKCLQVPDDKITVNCAYHDDVKPPEKFWIDTLGLTDANLRKSTVWKSKAEFVANCHTAPSKSVSLVKSIWIT
jgi:hypothetical protein